MRHSLRVAVGLISLVLACAGCWDVEEINRRGIIVALGLDPAPDGKVLCSVQLPILECAMSPLTPGGKAEKPSHVLSETAATPYSAIPALQTKTGRGLFLGQLRVIVLNAELARRGVRGIVDFLDRLPLIPPEAMIVITNRPAREVLEMELASKRLPAVDVVSSATMPSGGDQAFVLRKWQFIRATRIRRIDAFVPVIIPDVVEGALSIRGLAVFRGDKLAGELSGEEARMFGLLSGLSRNGSVTVPLEGARVTLHDVTSNARVRVIGNADRFAVTVDVRAKGSVVEMTNAEPGMGTGELREIQDAAAKFVRQRMLQVIQRLQDLRSDALGLGEFVRAQRPDIWRRIDWRREYPAADILVSVHFLVQEAGAYR